MELLVCEVWKVYLIVSMQKDSALLAMRPHC